MNVKLARTVIVVVSVLIVLAFFEFALRLFVWEDRFLRVYELCDNKEMVFVMKKHLRERNAGNMLITNGLGFRGKDIPFEKPAGTKRAVFLGDSIVFGWGTYEEEKSFVKVLEKSINGKGYKYKYEFINLAIGGYNMSQELATLKAYGMKYSPDIVCLGFFVNDYEEVIWFKWENRKIKSPADILGFLNSFAYNNLISYRYVIRSYLKIFGSFNEKEEWRIVESKEWKKMKNKMNEMIGLCRENDVKLFVIIFPYLSQLSKPQEDVSRQNDITKFLSEKKTDYIDMLPILKKEKDPEKYLMDTCHYNDTGSIFVADRIYEFLENKQYLK